MNVVAGSRPPWFPLPHTWRDHAVRTPGSVLLETAGGLGDDHISYLFTSPEPILRATSAAELADLLADVEEAIASGLYAAGRIDYEAAYTVYGIAAAPPLRPFFCLGLYREPLSFDHHTGEESGPALPLSSPYQKANATPLLSTPHLKLDRETYAEKFAAVQRFLAAGDTYQVNLTTHVEANLGSPPLELYDALIEAQPVDFAAVVHLDDSLTLSFSPELFFRTNGRHIVTRPMKGTAPRGVTAEEDRRQREWLAQDEKNHAEHVMIVDLLRNDLGRICEPGSVRTGELFRIEAYPTLFQMTSTISGTLRTAARFRDLLHALFPSGSITGAPKRRTMEIIRDLEDGPRGVYTGAIGFISPGGETCFSVPIRTLDIRKGQVSMGVGGGVVADSTAAAEYDECVLKASFLNRAAASPQLIETLLWDNGYPLLDLHLARLGRSSAALNFRCDLAGVRSALLATASHLVKETRVRLLLSADGSTEIQTGPITGPTSNLRVRLSARRVLSSSPWLQHKTTRRAFYDRELARARSDGFDEVLFLNERGELSEGAISTLFVQLDGRLYTPPLSSGALPGVCRQNLFNTQTGIAERILRLEDLAAAPAAFLGNAVRGLRSIDSFHTE